MEWPVAIVACGGFLLAAVIAWQIFATGRVAVIHGIRKEIAVDLKKENAEALEEFRATLAELVAGQREIAEGVTEVRARVAAIEKLLRDVG
ncbi:hypothetical protein [Cryptosporangium aurantiacum]|uniref:Uncharacterized protein n=1 Tax=Cryptosporangium aurantiacum TaxID=134849 RepID=A0A1M7MYK7_9ACTN|nr:hypothetical protein [Cryptosporangium aurantiacum]SHM96125.1 hypothetical protein SAMN05443668_102327 [Cryptosporangium aurantiacum]